MDQLGPLLKNFELLPRYYARLIGDAAVAKMFTAAIAWVSNRYLSNPTLTDGFIVATAMCVLDTITGVAAARVSGHKVTSAKLSRFFIKMLSYGTTVIVVDGVCHVIPGAREMREFILGLVVSMVVLTEGLSVLENNEKMGIKSFVWLKKFIRGEIKSVAKKLSEENERDKP